MVSLNFVGSLEADNPRSENVLELYPVWSVGVVFNEVFGELYGAEVAIWADTHEVRSVREEYSALVAAYRLNDNPDESVVVSSSNVLFVQVAFLGCSYGCGGCVYGCVVQTAAVGGCVAVSAGFCSGVCGVFWVVVVYDGVFAFG